MMRLLSSLIIASVLTVAAAPASAAQCGSLRLINSIPIVLDRGTPLIPVTIGGKPRLLLFDTGGSIGTIKKSVVAEFHLMPRRDSGAASLNAYGDKLDRKVAVPTLVMGRIRGNAWTFAVEPDGFDYGGADGIAGTLTPGIFRAFDIDLDFAAKKINLFSPDHCEGKVLYWQPKALAIVPIRVMNSGRIYARVTLDGQGMDALIDTGADGTVINATAARRLFGLDEKSPSVERMQGPPKAAPMLVHRFKSLSFEGIQVANPVVQILPGLKKQATPFNPGSILTPEEPQGLPDLIVGQSILSTLHVYIAYRERKLYVTNGDPGAGSSLPATR
jgi:hypothetical protein